MSLSEDERRMLRAALKNLRVRLGSWKLLGEAMNVPEESLRGISRGVDFGSMQVAEAAARVAGVRLDVLLGGRIVSADHCPECGQKLLPKPTSRR